MLTALVMYVISGCFIGVLAGLLGIGGGIVLVPLLNAMLPLQGVAPELVHHMALGTSMASIAFTAMSSAWSHNKRGTIAWPVVFGMTPGILLGTFSGTFLVARLPTGPLKILFAAFLVYT